MKYRYRLVVYKDGLLDYDSEGRADSAESARDELAAMIDVALEGEKEDQ